MPIVVDDLLRVGDALSGTDDEVFRRAAVGRHYYALYHHCLLWHGNLAYAGQVQRENIGSHLQLVEKLTYPDSKLAADQQRVSKQLAYKLNTARQRRVNADYALNSLLTKEALLSHSNSVKRAIVGAPLMGPAPKPPIHSSSMQVPAPLSTPMPSTPGIRRVK